VWFWLVGLRIIHWSGMLHFSHSYDSSVSSPMAFHHWGRLVKAMWYFADFFYSLLFVALQLQNTFVWWNLLQVPPSALKVV